MLITLLSKFYCLFCWDINKKLCYENFLIWWYLKMNCALYSGLVTKYNQISRTLILLPTVQIHYFLIQVDNGNTRTMCVICSKLRIETAERRNGKSTLKETLIGKPKISPNILLQNNGNMKNYLWANGKTKFFCKSAPWEFTGWDLQAAY